MQREELLQFINHDDYLSIINMGGNVVYGDGVALNTYNISGNIATINVDNLNRGWFIKRINNLKIGDIVEIEVEVRSISGVKPHLNVYKGTFNNAGKMVVISPKTSEWEVIKYKYIIEEDNSYWFGVGFDSNEEGAASFRNLTMKLYTNSKPKWTDIALSTGWENIDPTGLNDPKFQYKHEGDRVYIRGTIKQTTSASNSVIATLPSEIVPKVRYHSNIVAGQNDAAEKFLGLQINANQLRVRVGTIVLNAWVGISFYYDIDN